MSGKLPGIAPDVRPGDASRTPVPATRGRIWPAVALVILFWGIYALPRLIEWPIYVQFFTTVIDTASLTFLFLSWWLLTLQRYPRRAPVGPGGLVWRRRRGSCVSQKTMGTIGVLIFGLPIVFTAWAAWLLVGRNLSTVVRRTGLVAALGPSWGSITLLRMDGLSGDLKADVNWRWAHEG